MKYFSTKVNKIKFDIQRRRKIKRFLFASANVLESSVIVNPYFIFV